MRENEIASPPEITAEVANAADAPPATPVLLIKADAERLLFFRADENGIGNLAYQWQSSIDNGATGDPRRIKTISDSTSSNDSVWAMVA